MLMSHLFDSTDLDLALDTLADLAATPLELSDLEEIGDLADCPDGLDSLIVAGIL